MVDLACCAGGATKGYQRAGFHVIGVDVNPQPNYPGDSFVQADLGFAPDGQGEPDPDRPLFDLEGFVREVGAVFVHASFPCQKFTALNRGNANRAKQVGSRAHLDLITPNRPRLERLGIPYVLENVPGAPIRRDVQLCGEFLDLEVIRHRNFELNGWTAPQAPHRRHRGRVAGMRHGEWFTGPYFAVYGDGGGKGSVAQWQRAMGIDWTHDRRELAEAIPPAYTEYLGRYAIQHLVQRLTSERAA